MGDGFLCLRPGCFLTNSDVRVCCEMNKILQALQGPIHHQQSTKKQTGKRDRGQAQKGGYDPGTAMKQLMLEMVEGRLARTSE